jgi:hypothetical protein
VRTLDQDEAAGVRARAEKLRAARKRAAAAGKKTASASPTRPRKRRSIGVMTETVKADKR